MAIQPFSSDIFPSAAQGRLVNVDSGTVLPEDSLSLPWCSDPVASYLDYNCWVEIMLDAGMALHKPLPQQAFTVDSLNQVFISDPNMDQVVEASGVDMTSFSTSTDVIQRMATSTYKFILKGYGMRLGYQIPIPGIKQVGQVPAIPEAVQFAYNKIVGNLAGIPVWYAQWELHYIIAQPLGTSTGSGIGTFTTVPPNPALHIGPNAQLPLAILLPKTQTDSRAIGGSVLRTVDVLPGRR